MGGNRTIKTDVRVIVATNKDLRREVNEGRFRADLFTGSTFSRLTCRLCVNVSMIFPYWLIISRRGWRRARARK